MIDLPPDKPSPAASSAPLEPLPADTPRLAIVTCAVLEAEVRELVRTLPQVRLVHMMEQGLHNDPPKLRDMLQQVVDQIEQRDDIDAIVLGYGLCSRGTEGIRPSRCRIVIARAHDCITHLLGSRQRYAEYVAANPGTYWYSPGWNKHHIPPGKQRYEKLFNEYAEKFGKEDAEYLMEQEQGWFKSYERATYVHLSIGVTDQDLQYTRDCAQWLGWQFDLQAGDPSLMRDLLAGNWDDDRFVVVRPGQAIHMTGDDRVIDAAPVVRV
ncbi:MAG: DUF1638 domain-containing protein [Phycisphaeraceae bacterium]|nr:DUF1638 domain-containing protein [Phycisphaeraceae bacterium]